MQQMVQNSDNEKRISHDNGEVWSVEYVPPSQKLVGKSPTKRWYIPVISEFQ